MAPSSKEVHVAHPKKLGACIDKLYELRESRLEAQRAVDEMSSKETELHKHIIDTFSKADLDGASGKLATCSINKTIVPSVVDWDVLYKFIHKTKSFDLLERRVSRAAYKERLDAEEVVPGVESFGVVKLSLRKR